MARITFQKRQKEMKRQEKQRMKAEKRALRKVAKNAEALAPDQIPTGADDLVEIQDDLTDSAVN